MVSDWEAWGRLPGRTGPFRAAWPGADLGLGDLGTELAGAPAPGEPVRVTLTHAPQPPGLPTGETLPPSSPPLGAAYANTGEDRRCKHRRRQGLSMPLVHPPTRSSTRAFAKRNGAHQGPGGLPASGTEMSPVGPPGEATQNAEELC